MSETQFFTYICPNSQEKEKHPLKTPKQLTCQHIICDQCYSKATVGGTIQCPFCSLETTSASDLAIYEQCAPKGATSRGAEGPDDAGLDNPAEGKYMEEELMERYQEPSDLQWQELEAEIDQALEAARVRMEREGFQYKFEHITDDFNEEQQIAYRELKKKESEKPHWEIEKVILKLEKDLQNLDYVIGLYENASKTQICIDIEKGKTEDLTNFMQESYATELEQERFDIFEQECSPVFLVYMGAKIAVSQFGDNVNTEEVHQLIGQHPDNLLANFGSVTCLAKTFADAKYIITAKHVINSECRPQEAVGSFVSVFKSKLKVISNYFLGQLGGFEAGGEEPACQVDIAALKLDQGIDLDSETLHQINPWFTAKDDCLQWVKVNKKGATSNSTTGYIVARNYRLRQGRAFTGNAFLIDSTDQEQDFASTGDSGSLIWSSTKWPIGIVSMAIPRYSYRDILGTRQTKNVTLGVRLDKCFDALKEAFPEQDFNVQQCFSFGATLPLAEDPSLLNFLNINRDPPMPVQQQDGQLVQQAQQGEQQDQPHEQQDQQPGEQDQ